MKNKIKALLLWVWAYIMPDETDHHDSPFEYVTKKTHELRVGDYLVAYSGYIQRLGPEEYDGSRLVVTKCGHEPAREFQAYEDDEFSVRKLRGE